MMKMSLTKTFVEKDQETASTLDLILEDKPEHVMMGLLQFQNYLKVDQSLSQEKVDQLWEMENCWALFHKLEMEMKKQPVMGKVKATKDHLKQEQGLE